MSRSRPRRTLVPILGAAVCALVAIGYVGCALGERRTVEARDAELLRLRRLGAATVPDELASPPAEEENAGPLYQATCALFPAKDPRVRAFERGSEILGPRRERALAEAERFLTPLERAADRPKCVFRRDWSLGYRLEMPEYRVLRIYANALALKARDRQEKGDRPGATLALRRLLRMSDHLTHCGEPLGFFVGQTLEGLALGEVARMAVARRGEPMWQADLGGLLKELRPLPGYRSVLSVEIVTFRQTLKGLSAGNAPAEAGDGEAAWAPFGRTSALAVPGLRAEVERRVLTTYRRLWESLGEEADWRHIDRVEREVLGVHRAPSADRDSVEAIAESFLPAGAFAGQIMARTYVRRDLARAALRLVERNPRGPWPKTAADLPPDPFANRPVQYRPLEDGFLLYSVGPDGRDDGGRAYLAADLVLEARPTLLTPPRPAR